MVGHVADGNYHWICPVDTDSEAEQAALAGFVERMVTRAQEAGGTCTGEHGVGIGKREALLAQSGEAAVETMRALKRALDPPGSSTPARCSAGLTPTAGPAREYARIRDGHLAVFAAAPSKVPFYVAGGALALWAVVLAVIGITRPGFPGSKGGRRGVIAASALLVLAAMSDGRGDRGRGGAGGEAAATSSAFDLVADPSGASAYDRSGRPRQGRHGHDPPHQRVARRSTTSPSRRAAACSAESEDHQGAARPS